MKFQKYSLIIIYPFIHFIFCICIFIFIFSLFFPSEWGEHEIDYVLFLCVPSKSDLTVKPHPDEVDDVKWVTRQGLIDMMEDKSLLFSPWFRLICKKWLLDSWWKDLKQTMTTDKHCDYTTIHCFDPPEGK
jgi:isopentenyldiphosphate isomerase